MTAHSPLSTLEVRAGREAQRVDAALEALRAVEIAGSGLPPDSAARFKRWLESETGPLLARRDELAGMRRGVQVGRNRVWSTNGNQARGGT